ncbi:LuxR C-terminal-related transcriptional regulator [Streptomyces sp. GSL17-111]|uniref:LuxR C-terminal-related transcriptional regulator n=1 Tax=Streptomyces sp. GSL17-111 TaxID=3121596 RepID=UPI0030F482CF
MAANALAVFGVTSEEETLYRFLLRNPGIRADEVHQRVGAPREAVERGLERLQHLGLLRPDVSDRGLTPTSPDIAMARLMDRRLQELHEEIMRVTTSRYVVDLLRAEVVEDDEASPQGVEQLVDLGQIRNQIDELAFFAREEILSVEPYTRLTPENITQSRPLDLRCLRRGVSIRNVVRSDALEHGPTAAYLRELVAHGARVRVADDVTERILVYDRRTALVPIDPADTSRGALVTREGGLVCNIIALFEKIWEQADDLRASGEGVRTPPELTETERRVLLSMVSVGKDEAGARELGVSVRTYRRHVADLMRTLGAASRVQAALIARERGWV